MSRTTRIDIPAGSGFGLANLPYGIFSTEMSAPRVGVRVGDHVVDLHRVLGDECFAEPTLNAFMATGPSQWASTRERIRTAVAGDLPAEAVHAVADVTLHLPIEVADYVDFYASEHHASNLGRLFRPDNPDPLMPNWKHLPVGYHGRSARSSSPASTSSARAGSARPRPMTRRPSARAPASTSRPSSASSSGSATRWARRSRRRMPTRTSSAR